MVLSQFSKPGGFAGTLAYIPPEAFRGQEIDEAAADEQRRAIEDQIEREALGYYSTGRVRDDGIIDPRDTRTVLGMALSAVHSAPVKGTSEFGVFRM